MEARAVEVRGIEARSTDTRGPVPGPRGPIPSGIQVPVQLIWGQLAPRDPDMFQSCKK